MILKNHVVLSIYISVFQPVFRGFAFEDFYTQN
jgi:hypothetical protein